MHPAIRKRGELAIGNPADGLARTRYRRTHVKKLPDWGNQMMELLREFIPFVEQFSEYALAFCPGRVDAVLIRPINHEGARMAPGEGREKYGGKNQESMQAGLGGKLAAEEYDTAEADPHQCHRRPSIGCRRY